MVITRWFDTVSWWCTGRRGRGRSHLDSCTHAWSQIVSGSKFRNGAGNTSNLTSVRSNLRQLSFSPETSMYSYSLTHTCKCPAIWISKKEWKKKLSWSRLWVYVWISSSSNYEYSLYYYLYSCHIFLKGVIILVVSWALPSWSRKRTSSSSLGSTSSSSRTRTRSRYVYLPTYGPGYYPHSTGFSIRLPILSGNELIVRPQTNLMSRKGRRMDAGG